MKNKHNKSNLQDGWQRKLYKWAFQRGVDSIAHTQIETGVYFWNFPRSIVFFFGICILYIQGVIRTWSPEECQACCLQQRRRPWDMRSGTACPKEECNKNRNHKKHRDPCSTDSGDGLTPRVAKWVERQSSLDLHRVSIPTETSILKEARRQEV